MARSEIRVAGRACSLWALLAAAPGVLTLEDVLVGAFRLFVSTVVVERRASIFNTPHGLGISVPALLEALRWRYPGETSACRCWRLHWIEGASKHLLHALLAPLWHGGPVPARHGRTHMPGWDQAPLRRLVLVEGFVAGIVSAESRHVVGSRGGLAMYTAGRSRRFLCACVAGMGNNSLALAELLFSWEGLWDLCCLVLGFSNL